jgi:hypothetical protein
VSCQTDPRVSSSALPLAQSGSAGFVVSLNARSPDPAARGLNQWTVAVTDAAGAPLAGASLVLSATMPDHGHSSPAPAPPVTDSAGQSVLSGLDFFMPGVWRIQIDIYPEGATAPADSAVFVYCVEG